MDAPTITQLTTVAGASLVVALIEQLLMNAWRPSADLADRFGPLIAVGLGIVVVEAAMVVLGPATLALLAQGLVTGLFSGLAAMGIHNLITKTGASFVPPAA